MSTYKYIKDGKILGPVDLDRIKELARAGTLATTDQVSRAEAPDEWFPLLELLSVPALPAHALPFTPPPVASVFRVLATLAGIVALFCLFSGEGAAALWLAGSALMTWAWSEIINYLAKIHHELRKR